MIGDKIRELIVSTFKKLSVKEVNFAVEFPADLAHGDMASNVAMIVGKELKKSPKEVAGQIAREIEKEKPEWLEKIEVAGPGFINFFLSKKFFSESIAKIASDENFSKGDLHKNKKILVEYTDPNPFKEFHIGHLMANSVGEVIARLFEASGAEVKRLNYQGDVGLHVAKAIWGMCINLNSEVVAMVNTGASLEKWGKVLGEAYAMGDLAYKTDENDRDLIKKINEQLYNQSNPLIEYYADIVRNYEVGKRKSLEYFETIYKKLGTKFDHYFFESEVASDGLNIVKENVGKIFHESDGAVVFRGEDYGQNLHTRVFVNKEGLPTYEAKELGLHKKKFELFPDADLNVIVTANEVNDYFRVVLAAMREVMPAVAEKTKHISHGFLRLPSGKMSSRKGDVITAEALIEDVSAQVRQKMAERKIGKELATLNVDSLVEQIAVGAIKYSILKQAIGKDIIFDFEKSISFEGDSGPYLQYTHARTQSLLRKAEEAGVSLRTTNYVLRTNLVERSDIERLLPRFPDVIARAAAEYAPQYVVTFATEVASAFNSYYADHTIVDEKNRELSSYRLALTTAVGNILKNSLWILGIAAPEKM